MLFSTANDELLPEIAGKFFFTVVAVLVLNQKIVVLEQGIDFLWEKLTLTLLAMMCIRKIPPVHYADCQGIENRCRASPS
jgi:hypothetical protein